MGSEPKVTITKTGIFNFNMACVERFLKEAQFALLMCDRDTGRVGLRMVPKGTEHAYRVRTTKGGGRQVSASAFLKYYSIPCEQSRSYGIAMDDEAQALVFQPASE